MGTRVALSKRHGIGVEDRVHDALVDASTKCLASAIDVLERLRPPSRMYIVAVGIETNLHRLKELVHDAPAPIRVQVERP